MSTPIYLDYNATTPIAPEVAAAIRPWLKTDFGNPSSSHACGQRAHAAVAKATVPLISAKPQIVDADGTATLSVAPSRMTRRPPDGQ